MCTVTWYFTADGYELFFNRDELRSRAIAEPPTKAVTGDADYLAPTDSDAGGSWLAINQRGVAVGLLNAQPPGADNDGPWVSRGHLVRKLADLDHPSTLRDRLQALPLHKLRPFTLFALSPGGDAAVADFDGFSLTDHVVGEWPLLSSSSAIEGGATAPRERELERCLAATSDPSQARLAFHCSHEPSRGPLSPCMHRPDARTVSFSHIRVDSALIHFTYVSGPPCANAEPVVGLMPRVTGSSRVMASLDE